MNRDDIEKELRKAHNWIYSVRINVDGIKITMDAKEMFISGNVLILNNITEYEDGDQETIVSIPLEKITFVSLTKGSQDYIIPNLEVKG